MKKGGVSTGGGGGVAGGVEPEVVNGLRKRCRAVEKENSELKENLSITSIKSAPPLHAFAAGGDEELKALRLEVKLRRQQVKQDAKQKRALEARFRSLEMHYDPFLAAAKEVKSDAASKLTPERRVKLVNDKLEKLAASQRRE